MFFHQLAISKKDQGKKEEGKKQNRTSIYYYNIPSCFAEVNFENTRQFLFKSSNTIKCFQNAQRLKIEKIFK